MVNSYLGADNGELLRAMATATAPGQTHEADPFEASHPTPDLPGMYLGPDSYDDFLDALPDEEPAQPTQTADHEPTPQQPNDWTGYPERE